MRKVYFVTGIGTEIGKTVISTILVNKLMADYWKPIQCGNLEKSDSYFVSKYTNCKIFPERYKLKMPASPHAAAKNENISISLSDFSLPDTNNNLIIEGAGGLLVPINYAGDTMADLIKFLNVPVILVSKNYLGSINHTLLTYESLIARKIDIAGIIFNGPQNEETENIILKITGIKLIGKIPPIKSFSKKTFFTLAQYLEI